MTFEKVLLLVFGIACVYDYVELLLRYFGILSNMNDIPVWRLFATPFFVVSCFIFLGMMLATIANPRYLQIKDMKSKEVIAFVKYRGIGYHIGLEDRSIMKYMNLDDNHWFRGETVNRRTFKKSGKFNKVCRGLFVKAE